MPEIYQQYIYIVVSETHTLLGRIIQKNLRVNYNHCSIALDNSLDNIYSFGRKEIRNMFRAGFVNESKNEGFFKAFGDSKITVLKIPITRLQSEKLADNIEKFKLQKNLYKYSALGLVFCYLGIPVERDHRFFCSQFVDDTLKQSGISLLDKQSCLVRPHDYLDNYKGHIIYCGEIKNYCAC